MADPLELAAEEMAPSRASTNFFSEGSNPIFQSAMAGRRLEDQRLVGEELGGLTDSRLQRRLRRREEVLMDRDEQEYQAKQDWKTSRGALLSDLSRLDPAAPDYSTVRTTLLTSLPPAALEDDAVQSILHFQDRQNADHMQRIEEDQREERFRKRYEQKDLEDAMAEAARLGIGEDELKDAYNEDGTPNKYRLYAAIGMKERDLAASALTEKLKLDALKPPSPTAVEKKIGILLKNPKAFPSQKKMLYEKLKKDPSDTMKSLEELYPDDFAEAERLDKRAGEDYISAAWDMTEDQFVNLPGVSEKDKGIRREVYRLAWQHPGAPTREGEPPATREEAPAAPVPSNNSLDETDVPIGATFGG